MYFSCRGHSYKLSLFNLHRMSYYIGNADRKCRSYFSLWRIFCLAPTNTSELAIYTFLPVMLISVFRWFQLHYDSLLILVMICVLNFCDNLSFMLPWNAFHFKAETDGGWCSMPIDFNAVKSLCWTIVSKLHKTSLPVDAHAKLILFWCHQCLYKRKRQSVWYTMDGYHRTVHMPSDMCLWQRLQYMWRLISYTMLNTRDK